MKSTGLVRAHEHWVDAKILTLHMDGYNIHHWQYNIVPYSEPGEMSYIIWFELRDLGSDKIRQRINGKYVIAIIFE